MNSNSFPVACSITKLLCCCGDC